MFASCVVAFILAQTPPPSDSTSPPPGQSLVPVGEGKERVLVPPPPNLDQIAQINRVWRGVGLGLSNGLMGQSFAQSLRIDVPFGRRIGQFLGARVEGRYLHPPPGTEGPYDPLVTTGLALWGRGPVWQGLFRVYGGAGAWLGIRPNPHDNGDPLGVSGGGYFGVELLVARRMSFTFEVGGQGPAHRLRQDDAGARVMAGFMVYLGALKQAKR